MWWNEKFNNMKISVYLFPSHGEGGVWQKTKTYFTLFQLFWNTLEYVNIMHTIYRILPPEHLLLFWLQIRHSDCNYTYKYNRKHMK